MALPEHIDLSTIDLIREQLLSIINRDVPVLVADMTETISCDHTGSDALARAHQRAVASGTEMRLVVGSEIVRRVLSASGVGRLMSFYPTVEAALAATTPSPAEPVAPSPSGPVARPGETADVGVEVALLDQDGVIVSVNEAWQAFALMNGGDPALVGPGVSYLDICAAAAGDPVTGEVADGIRVALAGDLPAPLTVEVPCHSLSEARWFDMLISTRRDDDGRSIGATVTLSLARSESLALLAAGCRDVILALTYRLFGVSHSLQADAAQADGPLAGRLNWAINELDAVIWDARTAVFRSDPAAEPAARSAESPSGLSGGRASRLGQAGRPSRPPDRPSRPPDRPSRPPDRPNQHPAERAASPPLGRRPAPGYSPGAYAPLTSPS
ncbi:MAG: STAS domain-containing protein [Streptosporangiaceae bacterium]